MGGRFACSANRLLEMFMTAFGFNVYGQVPVDESSLAYVLLIYDTIPISPIPTKLADLYCRFCTRYNYMDNVFGDNFALCYDNKGETKIYEYYKPSNSILMNTGWGATVTKEGSIIYHGPKTDPRSEIAILTPFGYALKGLEVDGEIEVNKTITLAEGEWEQINVYPDQMFEIIYNTDSNPRIITQFVGWDTNDRSPIIKTYYHGEQIRRYSMKEFISYWYNYNKAVYKVHRIAPIPIYKGISSRDSQTQVAMRFIHYLKIKYAAEPASFDMFRNPDLVP